MGEEIPRPKLKYVDMFDEDELRQWCAELEFTDRQLHDAVDAVGVDGDAVRAYVERAQRQQKNRT
jgi:hypothetical protein